MPACSRRWSFLSLDKGFKFGSCAIAVSGRSKTSRDASIKITIVDTKQNRVFVMPLVFFIDASQKFENSDVPWICYFGYKPFSKCLIFLVLLMIQNLFCIMTGIKPELTGNQHSCLSSNKITRKCKQKSWLPTISFASSLLKHMGLHPLQDCKERRCQWWKEEQGDPVAILQDFTRPCILLPCCKRFDLCKSHREFAHKSTGSTASFETGKCNTNLIVFYRPWRSVQYVPVHLDIHPTLQK